VRFARRLHRLAIAIVALIVCAGIAVSGRGSARLIAAAFDAAPAFDAAARDIASAERDGRGSDRLHPWQDHPARRDVDLKAVESDDDEDGDGDDALCDVTHDAARSLFCLPVPPKPDRASRGEVPIDTSRFAATPGLPRGPPASRT
jgi:hypothetical protein